MSGRTVDALVIGGGPAGAVFGILAAGAGWSVVVVERGPRHRDKACGHCLAPRGVSALAALGLDPPMHRLEGDDAAVRLHYADIGSVGAPYLDPRSRTGALVRRRELDQWLLDAARDRGAEVLQPARAHVEGNGPRARVIVRRAERTTTFAPRMVVGADGLGSPVARALGLADRTAAGRKYGFAIDLAASAHDAGPSLIRGIELFLAPGGYVGVVIEPDGVVHLAGLVGPGPHDARDPVGFTRAVATRHAPLRRLGIDRIDAAAVRRRSAASPMPWRPRRVAAPAGALVGDAAGYVEPLTGEGMTWAVESAALLAEVAVGAGRGGWSDAAAAEYDRRHRRLFRPRQRLCGLVTGSLACGPWARTLFRSASRHPRLVRPLVDRVLAS